jgi:hypothetical protein
MINHEVVFAVRGTELVVNTCEETNLGKLLREVMATPGP